MPIQNACKEINFAASKRYFINFSTYILYNPRLLVDDYKDFEYLNLERLSADQ